MFSNTCHIIIIAWLLSKDKPRIEKYPYEQAPRDWSFLNMLPVSVQHHLGQWLGTRILQLNTGHDNFPEQFLVGGRVKYISLSLSSVFIFLHNIASLASRKAVSLLSEQLNNREQQVEELPNILGPDLLDRFLKAAPSDADIHLDISQIYDVNLGDIWITLGNPAAFSDDRKYEILRWMTVQIGLHKAAINENEESFQDYRQRISKSIMEGVQVGVDVLIDADITYKVNKKGADNDQDVILYDEGRRVLRMRFATPYFSPASKMVSGRDSETGEPINDWNWRLVDIDQLLEKEVMDNE